jgi:hypothetical protein
MTTVAGTRFTTPMAGTIQLLEACGSDTDIAAAIAAARADAAS